MQDSIIKGTGNSRYLKSVSDFMTLYPTYADFVAALVAGTLPIDLNGVNAAGWTQQGTALNKANLLTDATAAKFGLTASATLNSVLSAIGDTKLLIATGSYVGNGTYGAGNENTITVGFTPLLLFVGRDEYPERMTVWGNPTTWYMGYNTPQIMTWSATGVSWYFAGSVATPEDGATFQLNSDGITYDYLAIGQGVSANG